MTQRVDQGRLRLYLLGRLSPEEEQALEAGYFAEAELFEEMEAAEDDLIDAYVATRLAPQDRERFEARFLSTPERRDRVAFARLLRSAASGAVPPKTASSRGLGTGRMLALAAGLAVASLAGWALVQVRLLRGTLEQARQERGSVDRQAAEQRSRLDALTRDLALASQGLALASWTLALGLARDAEGSRALVLAPGVEWLGLELLLRDDVHPRYAAVVETPEGRRLAGLEGLRARPGAKGRVVSMILPVGLLDPGTYVVILSGQRASGSKEDVDAYHFRLARSPSR